MNEDNKPTEQTTNKDIDVNNTDVSNNIDTSNDVKEPKTETKTEGLLSIEEQKELMEKLETATGKLSEIELNDKKKKGEFETLYNEELSKSIEMEKQLNQYKAIEEKQRKELLKTFGDHAKNLEHLDLQSLQTVKEMTKQVIPKGATLSNKDNNNNPQLPNLDTFKSKNRAEKKALLEKYGSSIFR